MVLPIVGPITYPLLPVPVQPILEHIGEYVPPACKEVPASLFLRTVNIRIPLLCTVNICARRAPLCPTVFPVPVQPNLEHIGEYVPPVVKEVSVFL